MTLRFRAFVLAAVSVLYLASCGETFRPIATPVSTGGGDPQSLRHAIVISRLGISGDGAATHVNISGDSNVGQVPVGQDPVHAAVLPGGGNTYVINRASSSGKPSVTIYSTFSQPTSPALPLSATLPDNSAPVYVQASGIAVYIALSALNTVGVLIPGQNTLNTQIPVGTTPVAIAALPNQTKFYVMNQGSGNVSVIKPDNTVSATIPVGAAPSYAVASADNTRVYVVNRGSNSVSVIDSRPDLATTDTVINTVPVGASPNFAAFDARNLRVYVTNSGANTISVINADTNSPNYLAVTTVTVGNNPIALAVLADGSRVYVANSGSNSITVLSALGNTLQSTIALGGLQPAWIAASNDSSKVEVPVQDTVAISTTHADGSAILSIKTADNTITTIPAPFASGSCVDPAPAAQCARMRPSFVVITP
jgi:YVTN family beta-propeller protein